MMIEMANLSLLFIMKKCLLPLLVLMLLAPKAHASIEWNFLLAGENEVPPVATPGSGSVTALLDMDTLLLNLTGNYQDLLADVTGAHIHAPAASDENAGVIVPLIHTGDASGLLAFNGVIDPQHASWLLDGLAYVNVHTSVNPGGEIRGQFSPQRVPDTGNTALLLGAAAFLLLGVRQWTAVRASS
jgi:hypothetical protein